MTGVGGPRPAAGSNVKRVNARTKRVLDEALELAVEDRALIVAALDASLEDERADGDEGGTPEEIEQAWAEEIERRVEGVLAGQRQGRPADEAIAEVRATLQALRQR
jgi:Putative addiction module component